MLVQQLQYFEMKSKLLFINLLLFLFATTSFALEIPQHPVGYINDYAKLLSPQTISNLDTQLQQFEKETSNQIVVAIFPSLEQESLEDFSVRLEQQWKIGQKGKDNGVLLIMFVKEHKIRIEVGYGLEGAIPDALAGNIIDTRIAPYFKEGRHDEGVTQGVTALMQASQHEYTADKQEANTDFQNFIIAAVVLLIAFLVGRFIGPLFGLFFATSILGFYGFVFWLIAFGIYAIIYHLLPAAYRFSHPLRFLGGGFPNINFSSGNGFGSGDDSRGGGSGGGFSGGGGRSGGGGASGGW